MNKTKIDWADRTWNPVTGCLHGCEYCYARKIATRFSNWGFGVDGRPVADGKDVLGGLLHELDNRYSKTGSNEPYPFKFEPTLHKYRLDEPARIKKPQTIFVCSMADLFGDWVPDEWIKAVFKACEAAPQHRYLFLTKNPKKYELIQQDLSFMTNCYFGSSAANQAQMDKIRDRYKWITKEVQTFVSIEPIHEPVYSESMFLFDWIIVGAETGNRKNKPVVCKWWIDDLSARCSRAHVPLFMKESLRTLMGDDFRQEFPWRHTCGT